MTADTLSKISDFLRDTQVRVAYLTYLINSLRDQASTDYQEAIAQRKALADFIEVVYDIYAAPMYDGLTTFLQAPPLAKMDSTKYPAWTDREIVEEIDYLRYFGQLSYNVGLVFPGYYAQLTTIVLQGNWNPTTDSPNLIDSSIPPAGYYYVVVGCDDGFHFQDADLFTNVPVNLFTNDIILSTGTSWKIIRGEKFVSIINWVAGNYTRTNEYVWSSHNGPLQLFKLVSGTRPYVSSNIATEEAAGDWLSVIDIPYSLSQNTAAAGVIAIDLKHLRDVYLYGSAPIGEAKTWSIVNTVNNNKFYFKFTLSNTFVQTMPSSFKMSDPQWDSVAKTWTPIQGGEYEAFGVFTNGEWIVRIMGPYV